MGESGRFAMMACGKACALSVLMVSLSNQMSGVTGVDYYTNSPSSFLACGACVAILLACVRIFKHAWARVAFAGLGAFLVIVWICLLIALSASQSAGRAPSEAVLVAYAFLGRIATLFVNIQWNFHFSLNDVEAPARPVAVTVMLSFAFFFVYLIAPQEVSCLLMAAALAVGAAGNVVAACIDKMAPLPSRSVEVVRERDARHPAARESYRTTRALFFASRACYGVFLGAMVGIATYAYEDFKGDAFLMSLVLAGLVVAIVGAWRFASDGKGILYVVASMPITASVIAFLGLYPGGFVHPIGVFAMLAEVVWTTQNLLQLPSYRRMTGMHPGVFPYAEYIAQVIPFYLVAWFMTSNAPFGGGSGSNEAVLPFAALLCFVALACFAVGAMTWHIVRYLPDLERAALRHTPDFAREGEGEAVRDELSEGKLALLTPREKDVFALLAEGYSRPYIAKVLFISPDTVKVHARHIYAKLGVESHDGLIEFARGRK